MNGTSGILPMPAGMEMKWRTTGMNRARKTVTVPAAIEIAFGQLQVVAVEQEILADLEYQRLAAVIAHPVGGQRTSQRAETGGQHGQPEVPFAVGDQKTDKGHDRLARHRRNHAFQGHEDEGAGIGGGFENLDGNFTNEFGDHDWFQRRK